MDYKVKLFTGIRPTGGLTLANYVGAVKPLVELQRSGASPMVFVANLHALTDHEPDVIARHVHDVVADYIALGLDPAHTTIFVQSAIEHQVFTLMSLLSRHATVSELLRVPTLKDKLKNPDRPETATALLLLYPVMMAADILLQRAEAVPVGEDQLSHMEVTRKLARAFNSQYGDVFPIPNVLQTKTVRILSLKGPGKMSKSSPEGAVFLTDDPDVAVRKIKTAQTAFEGVMTDNLASAITLGKALTDERGAAEIDRLIQEHLGGAAVMGRFKSVLAQLVHDFLVGFRKRRAEVTADPSTVPSLLKAGAATARAMPTRPSSPFIGRCKAPRSRRSRARSPSGRSPIGARPDPHGRRRPRDLCGSAASR